MLDVSMRSLKNRLQGDPTALHRTCQTWGIDPAAQNTSALMKHLMDQVHNRYAARSVWEALAVEERLCLFHLFGSGNPARHKGMTLESLRKKTKLTAEVVEAAAERLCTHYYVAEAGMLPGKATLGSEPDLRPGLFPFRECFDALWWTGQELFRSYGDRSTSSLDHLLSMMHGNRLERLAQLCHVQTHATVSAFSYGSSISRSIDHPSQIKKRVYEAMMHPLIPFELLHRLPSTVQALFLWLITERNGRASMAEVRAYLSSASCPEHELHHILETLEAHALAFDTLTKQGERIVFVPQDLLTTITSEVQQRREDEQRYAFCPLLEHASAPHEGEPLLLYDLATVIGMSMQSTIEPTKDGRLPKRVSSKIRPRLYGQPRHSGQDDTYVDQVFQAAKELDLLRCSIPPGEEKQRYLPGFKFKPWSEFSLVQQGQRCLEWWTSTSCWHDVATDGRALPASSTLRQRVLEQLRQCVPGQWYRLDALLYGIWRQVPLSLYDYYHRALIPPTPLRSLRDQWMQREGALYMGLLASTLTELGIVALASTSPGPANGEADPDLFSVTAFGGAVLHTRVVQEAISTSTSQTPSLIVQPNYDVLLMRFEPRLVYHLLAFAQIERLGLVSAFRLTQPALLRGLAAGYTVEQIMVLLAEHAGHKELPQNVVYTLRDWAKAYHEVRLSEVILAETSQDLPLEEVQRMLGSLRAELRKVAPSTFIVILTGATFGEVRKRLTQAGLAVQGEASTDRRR